MIGPNPFKIQIYDLFTLNSMGVVLPGLLFLLGIQATILRFKNREKLVKQ